MSNPVITQSQKRFEESLGALFKQTADFTPNRKSVFFIKSSSDQGVIRNGGRNGARFAPQSLLSLFKKLNQNAQTSQYTFCEAEVASLETEQNDFSKSQLIESEKIKEIIHQNKNSFIYHIGGGHDHVYPLLKAYADKYKRIIVLNIDAHADTRTDTNPHSGTPFRQFASEYSEEFYLYQLGLHSYANSLSTLSSLPKGEMKIVWRKELNDQMIIQSLFQQIQNKTNEQTAIIFSIDADALLGSEVPGVSAVNHDGLTRNELLKLWELYLKLPLSHAPIMGLYELNPIYDTLSMMSMRTVASFLYEGLK
ncbi:MAG: arginase family protein [Bacteriovoracaceae bacterium]